MLRNAAIVYVVRPTLLGNKDQTKRAVYGEWSAPTGQEEKP